MNIIVKHQAPSAQDYCDLRKVAGLSPMPLKAAKVAVDGALYAVTFYDGERLIAMGRVIGDGACFFQIIDIAVHPDCQGQGLGKQVMEHIEAYLQSVTQPGSYVSLIGDKPQFYEKLGYQYTAPNGHGMFKKF